MEKGGVLRALVERKKLSQWFFNISKFSQNLLDGLDQLDNWPNKVKTMQKIGLENHSVVRLILKSK